MEYWILGYFVIGLLIGLVAKTLAKRNFQYFETLGIVLFVFLWPIMGVITIYYYIQIKKEHQND